MSPPAVDSSQPSASVWWAARRRRYNLALVVAGILAFICYVAAFEVRCVNTPGAEITPFTTLFQGILYLLAMGLANLCYQLGPSLERFIKPSSLTKYRKSAFRAGLVFSVALPFAIPLMILAIGCGPGVVYPPSAS